MLDQNNFSQKEYEYKFYEECCRSYHRIDDFRAKLLDFLPLVTGAGLFVSLNNTDSNALSDHLCPIGFFGFIVTLGLLFYELRGVQRCISLSHLGKRFEEKNGVIGPFSGAPHSMFRFINEPIAAGLIYSIVLGAWIYVAFIPFEIKWISAIVFIFFFS